MSAFVHNGVTSRDERHSRARAMNVLELLVTHNAKCLRMVKVRGCPIARGSCKGIRMPTVDRFPIQI